MTDKEQEFRQYAEECLRWAEETDSEEKRQAFLDMARLWIKAASKLDDSAPICNRHEQESRSADEAGPRTVDS